MRILLSWELGGGLGHLSILVLVARRLRLRGHEVLFAVKDASTAQHLLDDEGFRFVQCPQAQGAVMKKRSPASFSHILAGAGFADSGMLFGLVRAWQNLFLLFRPDVVLAQYAPTAQLSARLSGVPCLGLNTGFESPPETAPFPCFRPWLNLTRDTLLETEQVLLNNCNEICERLGAPIYPNLQQALKGDITLLAAFPEFDHYQGRTGGRFIGSLFITDDGVDIPWPEEGNCRVFVYLKTGAGTLTVLEKLLSHGASVIAFLPGSDETVRSSLSHERLRISSDKVKLSSLLPDMDLSVTHANHGTLSALFLAGVPMLMIPTTIEQWMLSSTVERLGIGIGVTRNRLNTECGPALEKLCADTAYRSAAARFAKNYAGYDQGRVLDRLAATIEGLPVWVRNKRGTTSQETCGRENESTYREGNLNEKTVL